MRRGFEAAGGLGVTLGKYHPIIADNVKRLKALSGMDEVSFHMSGTEAVMQAVRLARYHTGRTHLVRFCGAYHGWWDGVQAGVGNPLPPRNIYTLKEIGPRHAPRARDARRHRVRPGESHPGDAPQRRAAQRLDPGRQRSQGPLRQGRLRELASQTPQRVYAARDRAHHRRRLHGFSPRARWHAGVLRCPGRPRHLREVAWRGLAGRRGLRQARPDASLPRRFTPPISALREGPSTHIPS